MHTTHADDHKPTALAVSGGTRNGLGDASNTFVPDHDVCAAGMQECAPGNGGWMRD